MQNAQLIPRCLKGRSAVMLLAALPLLHGCKKETPPTRIQWPVMGTVAAVQCVDARAAPQARDTVQAAFSHIDASLSTWRADSEIALVNRIAGNGTPVPVTDNVVTVLRAAFDLCAKSGGAFNPLIGPVMKAWGFNGAAARPAPPDAETLLAAAALTDWYQIDINVESLPCTIRLLKPGMALDLGAIAKGYAVDKAWDALKVAGHTNTLVDLGGNLRALGEAAPGRGGWRTGIRNPFQQGTCLALFLLSDGESVSTSGNYERFVEIEGKRYAHIMDPQTAQPVTGMAGVTVVAPTATLADGLSTALFVLGTERGAALLKHYPGCEALWIPDTPGHLVIFATPGLAKRLTPSGNAKLDIRLIHERR